MDSKKINELLKFIFSKQFLKHLGIAIGIIVFLSMIALLSLRFYTHHGESIEVPNLKGMKLDKAMEVLNDMDLTYEVVDSVYMPQLPPGTIVEQTPAANEKIKRYRDVYLIINSYSKPMISLPDVRDLSYRNAKATLEAQGLKVIGVEYVPSEYKDLVQDVKCGGKILAPGARIRRETGVILVVGGNVGVGKEIPAPSFRGLKYDAAVKQANSDSLNIRSAQFDVAPKSKADSALFFVYKQDPIKGTPIKIGSSINIWLTKDKSLLSTPEEEYATKQDSVKKPQTQNKKDIEEFFK
jgi:eukaryotic-like serine/threonine-protein kinase